jgi:cell division protease FtsH
MQTNSAPVQKITMIPRTSGALGFTLQAEEDEHYLMTKEELFNKIVTLTGGRAAEELIFGAVSTGAADDITKATRLARAMVTRYGMSEEFGMVALENVTNQYLGGDTSWPAPGDATRIDQEDLRPGGARPQKAGDIVRETCRTDPDLLVPHRAGNHHA